MLRKGGMQEYTGTVTLDNVLDERALELYGEAPRWNDLQRQENWLKEF